MQGTITKFCCSSESIPDGGKITRTANQFINNIRGWVGEEEFINLHHSTVLRALIEEKNLLGALMIESPVYV